MSAQRPSKKSSGRGSQPSNAPQSQLRYPIPNASARAFKAHYQNQLQNPGLIFDRFAPDWSGQATLKKDGLEAVRKAAEKADADLLRDWNLRWEALVRAANAEPFSLKTDWRFIAGLGRKGALEVGFTFHRYGFPILPGSSVKGIARTWALIGIARKVNPATLKELDAILSADGDRESEPRRKYEEWKRQQSEEVQKLADDFRAVFGTTAAAGRAVFFDAIPATDPKTKTKPKLDLDVMNPHFPQYYQGKAPPTDWQSPVPVYFLTVAPNTEFRFAVGWRGALDDEGRRLRKLARDWLIAGLTELGAGAKTSAGYGYFVAPPSAPSAAPATQPTAAGLSVSPTPAATSAASTPTTTSPPPEEIIWRTGIVREYQPERGRGRLADDETKEEFSFNRDAIEDKGWSPGKKHKVRYALAEREGRKVVVKVQRKV